MTNPNPNSHHNPNPSPSQVGWLDVWHNKANVHRYLNTISKFSCILLDYCI